MAVGAFTLLEPSVEKEIQTFRIPLRDSKQLSRAQREEWFTQIESWQKAGKCDFAVSMVSAKEIDAHGISRAIKKALAETLDTLECSTDALILLDGSLHAPESFHNQITIIKGDEKEPIISLASIVAKVTRDRYMTRFAERYPHYGFERHMGYGTADHYTALKKYGLCPIHRRSFLKKL